MEEVHVRTLQVLGSVLKRLTIGKPSLQKLTLQHHAVLHIAGVLCRKSCTAESM